MPTDTRLFLASDICRFSVPSSRPRCLLLSLLFKTIIHHHRHVRGLDETVKHYPFVSLIPNQMRGKPLKAIQSMGTFFTICLALRLVGSVTGQGNSTAIASRLHTLGSPIKLCDRVSEGQNAFISCDEGIIDKIVFASYGTPTGSCETGFAISTCNSEILRILSSEHVLERTIVQF